jgi:hypothetical protein
MKTRKTAESLAASLLAAAGLLLIGNAQGEIISDFDDGIPDWGVVTDRNGNPVFTESGGQLSIRNQVPATGGNPANGIASVGWTHRVSITDGLTLEYRVDIVRTSRGDVIAGIEYNCEEMGLYGLSVNGEGMWLEKVDYGSGLVFARLFHEVAPVKVSNVILSLALTGVGDSVRITGKVLDKENNDAVLIERTVMDTPGVDPTVSSAEGVTILQPDPGPPFFRGVSVFLDLAQITDGNQPEAEVVYDNFTFEQASAAELRVERAVRLSWPAFSKPFRVEGAPTVEGPWMEVTGPMVQVDMVNYLTVAAPESHGMEVFRLLEVESP